MGADAAVEEQFGPYLVYERLGVGGMATVHRALERGIEGFERIVALKRLLPHLAEDASFIKSFVREAKLASLLNHVNIVQIFELGRVGTEYFISMEYIDGRDIRRILRHARKVTGPPPIHITVGLLLQLCDALDYAHGKADDDGHPLGLVHRDVSPSNLLITRAGHLKVIDFGIAKAQSSQLRTQTGRVKGKLAYMAPEAVAGKDLDSRSDLFAAGVIAHELLTARPLFASKNEYQTLLKVQRGDIMPPSTFNQACPAELDAIVLKALARDPDDRFADAAELREQLLELRRRHDLQTGHRDVAQWIDWAFSLEPPSGGFAATNTLDQTGVGTGVGSAQFEVKAAGTKQRAPTPRPRREDEEAVEIAWGGGDHEHSGAPIVLDDVPDVSDKHIDKNLGPAPASDDLDDDIPAPQPSHGRPPRLRAPTSRERVSSHLLPPAPARPTQPNMAVAAASLPARDRRTTAPGVTAQRAITNSERPSSPIEPRTPRSMSDLALDQEQDDAGTDTHRAMPALVRFGEPSMSPLDVPSLDGARIPNTRPGHAPARARGSTEMPLTAVMEDAADFDAASSQRFKRPSNITIGSAIMARQSPRRTWVLVLGLVLAGAAVAGVAFVMTREKAQREDPREPVPAPPSRTVGMVKFVTEPADAEIQIEGKPLQKGSPWSIELPAGIHQIQIQRQGFKAWLTSLELSANETQTLRVVLEPLGGTTTVTDATLILSSTPLGLEVVLDGQVLAQRTPLKMPLKPGPHTIVLRQNGVEVWRHDVTAQASVDYEFSPSMAEDKQRERAERFTAPSKRAAARAPDPALETPEGQLAAAIDRTVDKTADKPRDKPAIPPGSAATPPSAPQIAPPVVPDTGSAVPAIAPPVKPAPVAPITPPPPSGPPQIVAPGSVKRIAGETPNVAKSKRSDIPAVITAKVCIDTGGKVTGVEVLSKLERMTITDLTHAIRSWVYAPYQKDGQVIPVCFVVSFRAG